MKPMEFRGIIPPMMTAFNKDGEIYEKGTREMVEFIVPHVQGLYPVGSYGSGPMMSIAERKRTAEIVIDQVKGRVPVIVHVGCSDTKNTVDLAKHAESIGAAGVGAVTPYYNEYNQEAIYVHFKTLLDSVGIPVFVYNNPKLSGNTISIDTMKKLAKDGIAGIKDSTFDIVNYYHTAMALKGEYPNLNLIIGTEAMLVATFDAGAQAAVTGLGNVYPDLIGQLYKEYQAGDRRKLMETQMKVLRVRQITKFGLTVPTCHAVLELRGVDAGVPRLPFVPVSAEIKEKVKVELQKLNLL
ncbi:MAG: dihydrodipicolinate synthase family protein [Dehalococcoidia bacterium]|nr:dihydrodipicolinate synthase family protein [Dehalococcoidia bacterium]